MCCVNRQCSRRRDALVRNIECDYTPGSPIHDRDIATNYLRLILKVIGIEDVTVVAGGNAKAVNMGQTTRDAFVQTFASEISQAAAR